MEPQIDIPTGATLLAAHAAGDAEEVMAIIADSPLEAWFSVPPDKMQEILRTVPPELITGGSAARAFRLYLNGPGVAQPAPALDASDAAALFFDARGRGNARIGRDRPSGVRRRAHESAV